MATGWLALTALRLVAAALDKDTVALVDALTEPELREKLQEAVGRITEEKDPRIVEAVAGCINYCRDEQLTIFQYAVESNFPGAKDSFCDKCWEACGDYRREQLYDTDFEDTIYLKFMMAAGKIYDELKTNPDTYLSFLSKIDTQNREILRLLKKKAPEEAKVPRLLTEKPGVPKPFLYREDELNRLREALKTNHCVSLNGTGGVGKTTLAQMFFSETWQDYDHAAWVSYNGNLDNSLLGFTWPSNAPSPREKLRQIYERILNDPDCRTLLVIDNVDEKTLRNNKTEGDKFDSFTSSPFLSVVVTQRSNALGENYYSIPVSELDEQQCAEVFEAFYKAEGRRVYDRDQAAVAELVRLAWRNTKVLRIMAKSVSRTESLSDYAEKLNGHLNEPGQPSVALQRGGEERTLPEHLRLLFPLSERTQEERRVLQGFALMPSVPIPAEAAKWLQTEQKVLQALCDGGWLDAGESEETQGWFYSMHPLVKETVLLDRGDPALFPASIGEDFATCVAEKRLVGETETYETALPKLAIADGVLTAMGERETDTYARACDRLASLYRKFGSYNAAEKWFLEAVGLAERVWGTEHPDTAATYNNLAGLYRSQGKYREAEAYYLQALAICEKVLGKEHPDTATTYNNLATLYDDQGKYPEAEEYYLQALAIREKVLGTEHPSTATTYNNLALLYYDQGKYPEAEKYYRKALAIREKVLGKDHPSTATTYHNLGCLYDARGDYDRAMEWFEKALPVWLKNLGSGHPNVKTILAWMRLTFPLTALAERQDFDPWLKGFLAERRLAIPY